MEAFKGASGRGRRKWPAGRRTAVSAAVLVGAWLAMAGLASPAFANAPNPIAGTTIVDSVVSTSSGVTVTVQGQWNWVTQTDCPTARDGVGYQVAWFDGNTANPIGNNNSPDGIIDVGDSTDNIVHSIDALGGSAAFGNAFFDGVPSSYLMHNVFSSTPTQTDAKNWVSNCNNEDPTTKISSGVWGPISHTYPAGTTSITLCPVMYDPHGHGTSSGGTIGSSGVGDITAGGGGHNGDNSYEGNGVGANGNICLVSTFTIPPPNPPSTPPPTTTPSPTPTPVVTAPVTVKKHKKHHKHHKKISRKPKHKRGFTG